MSTSADFFVVEFEADLDVSDLNDTGRVENLLVPLLLDGSLDSLLKKRTNNHVTVLLQSHVILVHISRGFQSLYSYLAEKYKRSISAAHI